MEDEDGNILENKEVTEAFDASVVEECFIATAAYGSKLDPSVTMLRRYRDQKLLGNPIGQLFVHLYYELSPPVAASIAEHELLRSFARAALLPVIAVAYLSLYNTIYLTLALFILFLLAFTTCRRNYNAR